MEQGSQKNHRSTWEISNWFCMLVLTASIEHHRGVPTRFKKVFCTMTQSVMEQTFLNTSLWNGTLYIFFNFWHTFQWHFLYFLKKKCFISSSKGKNGLYWSLKHSFPCFCFLRLFKTTRNERWSRSARNISTAFWNIFTCPHGLCVCVVQLLSNLFKWWWFLVFQWYLMTDVSFAIIFPWHAFCELVSKGILGCT